MRLETPFKFSRYTPDSQELRDSLYLHWWSH